MILKFKRFWACLILIACTFGLITPMPTRANGNVELQVLGIYGAGALIGGAIGVIAGKLWLRSCRTAATIQQKSRIISIDRWCNELEDNEIDIAQTDGFKLRVDGVLDADEKTTKFKKSYKQNKEEDNKYSTFLEDIDVEMASIQNVMERAKNFSFVSGITESLRVVFTMYPEKDWKYQQYRDLCAKHNLIVGDNVYPEKWTKAQVQAMQKSIYEYIENEISGYNGITKLGVEVWWLYFKKYYRLQRLRNVIEEYSVERGREIERKKQQLATAAANAQASAQHTHQHVHVDNNRPAAAQPQPVVQPLQVAQQKPNYLKRAAYVLGAALMGVGLYVSGKMVSHALNMNDSF